MKKSCLRCSKYITCREEAKAANYFCQSFSVLKTENLSFGGMESLIEKEQGSSFDVQSIITRKNKDTFTVDLPPDLTEDEREVSKILDKDPNFIAQAMKDAYDPLTNSVRDLKIDDRDLPSALNYFDFCSNVAGRTIKTPFARQLWIASQLLGEYCPRCTNPKWLNINNVPVDADPHDLYKRLHVLHNGVCPKCGVKKSELILKNEIVDFNQLALIAGQRAGKSSYSSTVAGYILHRYLKAPRMSTICRGIQEFSPLTFTFVGITAARSIKLLWNPLSAIVTESTWFQEYFKILDNAGRLHSKEFYRKSTLFMKFYNKNIELSPAAPLKRTLRGDTRILGAVDELSWFPYKIVSTDAEEGEAEEDEREHANADEVHQALEASLTTIRTEVLSLYKRGIDVIPTGYNLNISSPQSELDKLSRLYRECVDNPKETLTLAIRLPTWELSPIYSKDHPIIRASYAKNPRKAERDYGANPPKLSASVFKPEKVLPLFNMSRPNSHRILYDNTDPDKTRAKVVSVLPRSSWKPQILVLDAGLSNNSFAIAMGEREESKIVVNAALEVIPAKGTHIHFPTMLTQVILPMIKECNVAVVAADHWNSIDLLQQIEDQTSARVFQKTLTGKNISALVASIESGGVDLPAMELDVDFVQTVRNYKSDLINSPMSHLFLQMLTVREYQGTIVKGEGFTDDIFRCLALLHAMAFNKQSMKIIEERPATALNTSEGRARVMVAGRSSIGQWLLN